MLGQSPNRDQGFPVKDPIGMFGAATQYERSVSRGYAYNGEVGNLPILNASNKPSEHNILNAPFTPAMVVAQLPSQKMPRQTGKILSLPIKIPGLSQ